MLNNPVIKTLMNRKSIRDYTDQEPSQDVVETVVRAGQQAPFAYQMGSLAQDYYRQGNAMIPLEGDREETYTYETYSWTEHISRKTGQWMASPDQLLEQFAKCGFHIPGFEPAAQD